MTYYVLRQIHPPGKSARADEATMVALTGAVLRGDNIEGDYLEWSNPDARHGRGDERWTAHLAKAKRFATFREAMECWKAQSTIRPFRPDGAPNRPMTAYSVSPVKIEE
jgi:hypothetical protein